jgi:signal transduction histidine kinase
VVIFNLILNAAQAIADTGDDTSVSKGTITIRTRYRDDDIEIEVEDTGIGIAEDIGSKVFDPFFTTREPGKGMGQGLSIAHGIVVGKYGGRIRFETQAGRGTKFIIRLPVTS